MTKKALITGVTGQDGAQLAEFVLGDPSKAKQQKLGWTPKISFDELVAEIVREYLKAAKPDELVKKLAYKTMDFHE